MRSSRHLCIENPHQNYKFWHKVQIHCHSQESDAKRGQTPTKVEEAYRDAGYRAVFLTDHNMVTPDPGVGGILHIDSAEYGTGRHHALVLAIDHPSDHQHRRDHAEGEGCACKSIPKRLNYITRVQKAVAIVAHPNARHFSTGPFCPHGCGCGWSPQELVSYAQQYSGIEIFNANIAAHRMWGINRWDDILGRVFRKIWGFASDDCHDVCDQRKFDRGWILVNSQIDPDECCQHGLTDPVAIVPDCSHGISSIYILSKHIGRDFARSMAILDKSRIRNHNADIVRIEKGENHVSQK
jgi:hypothetical protein